MEQTVKSLRILVTGGAGFLGSNLIEYLLAQGHEVVGIDNFENVSPQNLDYVADHPRFNFVKHDIQSPLDFVGEIDQIYNLACPASPIQYQKNPVSTLRTCFIGVDNLLNLAQSRGIRILHTSTSEVYGDPHINPQPESYWGNVNPFGPRSCYDEGKRVAEALCYAYREQHGIDIRIARIFNTYGPRMSSSDGRVVSSFIAAALEGKELEITGDGTSTRSFQYVTDCVEGLVALMNSDYNNGPMNIGNDEEFTIQQLAEIVVELVVEMTGKPKVTIVHRPPVVDDPTVRRPQITLARETLRWRPTVQLREGLRKTIQWHIEQGGISRAK
ncbi:UDP-glucuronic acid decarboxylase 1 [Penicillium canariense]|uniref:UDP-glucuronic acid decarboxylase 1 n=1 Tax=Penicillium canariense TaxID=189055 RepID=A0A9W9LPG5_9EURO|nr:UDP-glucuronic acid decarboxylase 1 [Penicillium canariense]KAJ5168939.1 UDP-glucuronic acid decarboxylase 1 [Penicillium canariense]